MSHFIDDDDELQAARAQALLEQRRRAALWRHFDCRDPDHPGCSRCMEDEESQDEEVSHV